MDVILDKQSIATEENMKEHMPNSLIGNENLATSSEDVMQVDEEVAKGAADPVSEADRLV